MAEHRSCTPHFGQNAWLLEPETITRHWAETGLKELPIGGDQMARIVKDIPLSTKPSATNPRHEEPSTKKLMSPTINNPHHDACQRNSSFNTLSDALNFHMSKLGDTSSSLTIAVLGVRNKQNMISLRGWCTGRNVPRRRRSLEFLKKIERHYQLPVGYFARLIVEENPSFKNGSRKLDPFHSALNFQMQMHEDSSASLAAVVAQASYKKVARSITGDSNASRSV
jgi:hypothetical protein